MLRKHRLYRLESGRYGGKKTALSKLKFAFRAAVVMRDARGMNYEEIAAALELSVGTVKSRIACGRAMLRTVPAAPPGRASSNQIVTALDSEVRIRSVGASSGSGLPAGLAEQPDGLLVIAEVSPSGEAHCVGVVKPHADATLVAAVDRALQRMTFRPAT
ncbi:MAG: sigma factor-like helix-turn-helix DNA-binding protein [Acidobacteriota bacterium]|nr:sigma factor-like helix-turn-helix DNA-binding protein [Acidobacteriota bacterium]